MISMNRALGMCIAVGVFMGVTVYLGTRGEVRRAQEDVKFWKEAALDMAQEVHAGYRSGEFKAPSEAERAEIRRQSDDAAIALFAIKLAFDDRDGKSAAGLPPKSKLFAWTKTPEYAVQRDTLLGNMARFEGWYEGRVSNTAFTEIVQLAADFLIGMNEADDSWEIGGGEYLNAVREELYKKVCKVVSVKVAVKEVYGKIVFFGNPASVSEFRALFD